MLLANASSGMLVSTFGKGRGQSLQEETPGVGVWADVRIIEVVLITD